MTARCRPCFAWSSRESRGVCDPGEGDARGCWWCCLCGLGWARGVGGLGSAALGEASHDALDRVRAFVGSVPPCALLPGRSCSGASRRKWRRRCLPRKRLSCSQVWNRFVHPPPGSPPGGCGRHGWFATGGFRGQGDAIRWVTAARVLPRVLRSGASPGYGYCRWLGYLFACGTAWQCGVL